MYVSFDEVYLSRMVVYLWLVGFFTIPALVTGYIHTLAGVKYKVSCNFNPTKSTCVVSVLNDGNKVLNTWAANVTYRAEYKRLGWDYLEVTTNPDINDSIQAYTAGYCEGYMTCESIYNHWTNIAEKFCNGKTEFCDKVNSYLDGSNQWINNMIKNNIGDRYWHQISLFYRQIDGIYYGQKRCKKHLPAQAIFWMNMFPEIEEMEQAFNKTQTSNSVKGLSRCSAIVKLLPDYSDLLVAHDTWTGYEWMLRQVKKYSFGFHESPNSKDLIFGNTVTFSGYPGITTSIDDFYIINSGLVVLETTIGNDNMTLWVNAEDPTDKISTMARSTVANRLAKNGSDWVNIFKYKNSGLYNNQWIIVDMKRFTPGSAPKSATLFILEQIPTWTSAADQTEKLKEQSYWPSYNVPFFPEVYNLSGCPGLVQKYGSWFSYDNTARALIFKRDQSKVVDTISLTKLMRYNDFKNDPFSRCNCTPPYSGENGIAARCDLNPINGTYPIPALGHRSHGAIDAKITTYNLSKSLQFLAINGPSNGTDLPEFDWSKSDFKDTVNHKGQPDVFRFPLMTTDWETN